MRMLDEAEVARFTPCVECHGQYEHPAAIRCADCQHAVCSVCVVEHRELDVCETCYAERMGVAA